MYFVLSSVKHKFFYVSIVNMIKYFVVGCFFKASLSRLATNRLSSSAKTLEKSSASSGVQLRQRTFALHLPSCSSCGCWLVLYEISLLYVVSVLMLKITYCVWLQKPNLCKENDYTNILYFLYEHNFEHCDHWLHDVTPGTLCKHHTTVDSAWKRLLLVMLTFIIF